MLLLDGVEIYNVIEKFSKANKNKYSIFQWSNFSSAASISGEYYYITLLHFLLVGVAMTFLPTAKKYLFMRETCVAPPKPRPYISSTNWV